MIKFYGSISEDNKKILVRKEKVILFFASLIPVLIGIGITIALAIKIDLLALIFLIPLLFFLSIPLFPVSKKTLSLMIPHQIIIDDEIIISEGENFKCYKNLVDIKKIVDYGTYYYIFFKWPKKSYRFLCQKNLLLNGTIEDFEKRFVKIERRYR